MLPPPPEDHPVSLVEAGRYAGSILLDGRAYDVSRSAVMTAVHHLGPMRLQQTSDQIDRRVLPIEGRQSSRRLQRIHCCCSLRSADGRYDTV
jgi:hypothetical protein